MTLHCQECLADCPRKGFGLRSRPALGALRSRRPVRHRRERLQPLRRRPAVEATTLRYAATRTRARNGFRSRYAEHTNFNLHLPLVVMAHLRVDFIRRSYPIFTTPTLSPFVGEICRTPEADAQGKGVPLVQQGIPDTELASCGPGLINLCARQTERRMHYQCVGC